MAQDTIKPARSISVTATPTLVWNADGTVDATVEYEETASDPPMPGVVDRHTGDINLRKMPSNANYNFVVALHITLDTSKMVDPQGNPVAGRFAQWSEAPMAGAGPVWLCKAPGPGEARDTTPIYVLMMILIRTSDTLVTISDAVANDGPDYEFCLGLVLPDHGNRFITIDPRITSKGVGQDTR